MAAKAVTLPASHRAIQAHQRGHSEPVAVEQVGSDEDSENSGTDSRRTRIATGSFLKT